MSPFAELPLDQLRELEGLLFDLDETLLHHGQLSVNALQALYNMKNAGLRLVGVTGRPCSWGQVLLRQWPIDAMLTENGTVGLSRDGGRMVVLDRLDPDARRIRQQQLQSVVATLRQQFPELRASEDVDGRQSDYTFDTGEYQKVSKTRIDELGRAARAAGARVVVSSIHLHVTLDGDDKASGSVRLLHQLFGVDATAARYRYAYIGDSGNDAPCFAAFHHSIGVANLQGFMPLLPRWQTEGTAGGGFCEVAARLVESRSPHQPSRS